MCPSFCPARAEVHTYRKESSCPCDTTSAQLTQSPKADIGAEDMANRRVRQGSAACAVPHVSRAPPRVSRLEAGLSRMSIDSIGRALGPVEQGMCPPWQGCKKRLWSRLTPRAFFPLCVTSGPSIWIVSYDTESEKWLSRQSKTPSAASPPVLTTESARKASKRGSTRTLTPSLPSSQKRCTRQRSKRSPPRMMARPARTPTGSIAWASSAARHSRK